MAGGKKAYETLIKKDKNYFSKLAKKRTGKKIPKSGLASAESQRRRWVALKGVIARGDTLKPELLAEFKELDTIYATGIRTRLAAHQSVLKGLQGVLND